MNSSLQSPLSNVRVFTEWFQQTVFAGEDIRCVITFKNTSKDLSNDPSTADQDVADLQTITLRDHGPPPPQQPSGTQQQRNLLSPSSARLTHHRGNAQHALAPASRPKPGPRSSSTWSASGHSTNPSLDESGVRPGLVTATLAADDDRARGSHGPLPSISSLSSLPLQSPAGRFPSRNRPRTHQRSISVLSLSSAGTGGSRMDRNSAPSSASMQRPRRMHSRATSLQMTKTTAQVASNAEKEVQSSRPAPGSISSPIFVPDRRPVAWTEPNTPWLLSELGDPSFANFRFPAVQPPDPSASDDCIENTASPFEGPGPMPRIEPVDHGSSANRVRESERANPPVARIITAALNPAGTPRTSGEFYSLSNHSSETLASEYLTQHHPARGRGRGRTFNSRLTSSGPTTPHSKTRPECLMMGYAQVQGSFTLDGSLVNLAPFEMIKKKAIVGGHGGGVVGVDTTLKRDGGLLGGFGWGTITNSIGELLGSGDLSTVKEMRGMAGSRSVPLLSTPQSVLFVDLRLAAGESKAFEYTFKLPRGLPPSHRGKAIKISYSLVVGTQRPGGAKEQQLNSVELPFRVLSGVNGHGEILGHDLMSPYVILHDQARIKPVDGLSAALDDRGSGQGSSQGSRQPETGSDSVLGKSSDGDHLQEFVIHVQKLLSTKQQHQQRRQQRQQNPSGSALLSPGLPSESRRQSVFYEDNFSVREAIDLAILRSNMVGAGQQSPNRFEIARKGRRVAVVMLARPAYRLGETVSVAVDLAEAEVACYAIHFSLETSERVDPSLAVRSEASLARVTRRVHAFASEAVLFSRRAVFRAAIPIGATPEFLTSHICLDWRVRIEFVVSAVRPGGPPETSRAAGASPTANDKDVREGSGQAISGEEATAALLLERLSCDDKGGAVLVAVENVWCDSFEVVVPLRVYGAAGAGLEQLDRDDGLGDGFFI